MDFFLTEDIKPLRQAWDVKQKHLFLGSCFADDIGALLKSNGVNAIINPTGTLFHPQSILKNIQLALDPESISEKHFVKQENVCFSLDFHSSNFGVDITDFKEKVKPRLSSLITGIKEAKYIVLTFGTSFYYSFDATGEKIVNCQKQPGNLFTKHRSSVAEVVETIQSIYDLINTLNSDVELLFTVSPVRHKKEGLHENNLSKSTLLLAVDEFVDCKKTHYFPSYELVLDTLRDYRFFTSDRVHVTAEAQHYVYDKMIDFAYQKDRALLKKISAIQSKISHQPIHPNKPSAVTFKEKLEEEIEWVKEKLPHWEPILPRNSA